MKNDQIAAQEISSICEVDDKKTKASKFPEQDSCGSQRTPPRDSHAYRTDFL